MNNEELDGISLTEHEKSLIRQDRAQAIKDLAEKQKKKLCKHEFTRYLGHSHNDDAYQCPKCGDIKYV